ncbi:MAG: rod shape-determining protein MreC [Bacteroidales bacterium]
MALPDIRQRAGLLFLVVAVGHIVLISAQVNSRSGVPLLQAAAFGAFSQVQRAAAGLVGGGQAAWKDYVDLRRVRAENADLRRRNAELQVKLQRQHTAVEENARLQQLLELRSRTGLQAVGAAVIGGSVTPDFRTVTIDKGRADGMRGDLAVLAAAGVVGRVVTPSRGTSKVQLLVDRNAAIAGLVERSRAQGILVGTGEDVLRVEYLPATADVKVGDTVVSSGIDGIYPKGLIVGRVERVDRAGTGYKSIVVRPAVDFGALEEVLVVTSPPAPRDGGPR